MCRTSYAHARHRDPTSVARRKARALIFDVLLKGGTVVTGNKLVVADIGVRDGLIVAIGRYLASDRVCPVFDLRGKWVLPGLVDTFSRAAGDDEGAGQRFLQHSARAALGGVTLAIEVVTPKPWESPEQCIARAAKAWPTSWIDRAYGVRVIAGQLPDLEALQRGKRAGLAYVLVSLSPRVDGFGLDDAELFQLLRTAAFAGVSVMVSAEHQAFGRLVETAVPRVFKTSARELFHRYSPEGELVAVARAIAVAEAVKAPVHLAGVTSPLALAEVSRARQRGAKVTAHVAAHSLLLSREVYKKRKGRWYRPMPPLRPLSEHGALFRATRDGGAVAITAAGSSSEVRTPWSLDKNAKAEGLPLLPWAPRVLLARLQKRLGDHAAIRAARWLSQRPFALAGLGGDRGNIAVGTIADLVAFDPVAREKLGPRAPKTSEDWNPLSGLRAFSAPLLVLNRGRVIVERGELKASEPKGEAAIPLALRG